MTQTGKKARKRGGTRYACKRAKARSPKLRSFGRLAYSVASKNADQVVAANERVCADAARQRRAKGFEPDANVAVPCSKTADQVAAEQAKVREAERRVRREVQR